MQPVLFITSAVPGLLYINGRMAGEVDESHTLTHPVAAFGPVYIEHHPFANGYPCMCRRLVLSAGRPVIEAIRDMRDVFLVCWPDGVTEVELKHAPAARSHAMEMETGGMKLIFFPAPENRLELSRNGNSTAYSLPEGALTPEVVMEGGIMRMTGSLENGGQYALMLSAAGEQLLLSVSGREVHALPGAGLRVLSEMNDTVGHARLETWSFDGEKYVLGMVEPMWSPGAPHWPDTPQTTVLAAVEAAMLNLTDEVMGYLTESAGPRCAEALHAAADFMGCVPLKFPLSDGRSAIGLMKLEAPNCVSIRPLLYRAVPGGGAQGAWRVESLALTDM